MKINKSDIHLLSRDVADMISYIVDTETSVISNEDIIHIHKLLKECKYVLHGKPERRMTR